MKVAGVEAVARALNEARVEYLIVGRAAVVAHGYGRQTQALDLVISLEPDSIHRAFAALAWIGYRPRVPVTSEGFADPRQRLRWIEEKGMTVLNFHSDSHRETPVDLFVTEPFDFPTEHRLAVVEDIAPGVSMRFVRLEELVCMKLEAGRPQDLADVAELRMLETDETRGS